MSKSKFACEAITLAQACRAARAIGTAPGVEPAFSWGFFDRLVLMSPRRRRSLRSIGDQIDMPCSRSVGQARLSAVMRLGKCFLRVRWGGHFLVRP